MTLQQDQFVKSFESETKTRPILQRYRTQMKPELRHLQSRDTVQKSGVIPGCVKKKKKGTM